MIRSFLSVYGQLDRSAPRAYKQSIFHCVEEVQVFFGKKMFHGRNRSVVRKVSILGMGPFKIAPNLFFQLIDVQVLLSSAIEGDVVVR